MREQGIVQELKDNQATVIFQRHSACQSCGACKPLHGKDEMAVVLPNTLNAKIGDVVTVELESKKMLSATFLAYGVPLIFLIIGAVCGELLRPVLGYSEVIAGLIALSFAAISYGILKALNPVLTRNGRFTMTMRDIISKADEV